MTKQPGEEATKVRPGRTPGIPSGEAAKVQLRWQDAKQLTEQARQDAGYPERRSREGSAALARTPSS